ncbi:unnamed protein product [Phaedon cochleariae]|uniref:Protein ALP1-like n=1 Tax=Phaedon cochleariae TaxID=80249 RepID=A0A9N9SKQ3_PHACE|nr:unnamed protein product [Phaedon cochleariae]
MYVSSSSDDEDIVVAALLAEGEKKRRMWVHPINQKRANLGEFHHLFSDLREDEHKFFQYFRMSPSKFSELLNILEPALTFQNTPFRRAISKEERLAVALKVCSSLSFQALVDGALTCPVHHGTFRISPDRIGDQQSVPAPSASD